MYKVKIVETLVKVVEVDALNDNDAFHKVKDSWSRGEIILSGDDFCDVEFYNVK